MSIMDRYLQMQLMGEQGNQPTPGPAPQLPQEDVPRRIFDPLSKGASEAINSVRQSLGHKKPSMLDSVFNTIGHAGNALMASDTHPFVQAMGQHGFQQEAQAAAQEQENMKIMEFLQKAEQARQKHLAQQQHYAEQERHNKAIEGLHGQGLNLKAGDKNLYKQLEHDFYQQHGIRGKLLDSYSPSMQLHAEKKQEGYVHKADAAYKAKEASEILHSLASDPKTQPIFNSHTFAMMNKYSNNPDLLNTWVKKHIPANLQDAAFLANSASKTLYLEGVKQIPAKGLNQNIEGVLRSSYPSAQMSPKTVKELTEKAMEEYDYYIDEYGKANKFFNEGYDITVGPRKPGEKRKQPMTSMQKMPPPPETGGAQAAPSQQVPDIQALDAEDQQLMMREKQLEQQMGGQR